MSYIGAIEIVYLYGWTSSPVLRSYAWMMLGWPVTMVSASLTSSDLLHRALTGRRWVCGLVKRCLVRLEGEELTQMKDRRQQRASVMTSGWSLSVSHWTTDRQKLRWERQNMQRSEQGRCPLKNCCNVGANIRNELFEYSVIAWSRLRASLSSSHFEAEVSTETQSYRCLD